MLFYTIDNNIYSQVLPSDLIAGTFYCTEDTICALADSAIANDAKIDILVKFNNHDGKKINFAWSNQRL
ncbi:MAG: hypothetical protein MJ233_05275 [Mycoplasmoidaceae bacterium]|nr:hypothetical protein [Mycoplasmoidaceae bacterium]